MRRAGLLACAGGATALVVALIVNGSSGAAMPGTWVPAFGTPSTGSPTAACADGTHCVVVGLGRAFRTSTAGSAWTRWANPGVGPYGTPMAADCPTASRCEAFAPATDAPLAVFGSANGGKSWVEQLPIGGTTSPAFPTAISCPTAQVCMASYQVQAGLFSVLSLTDRTTDGGQHWRLSSTVDGPMACPTASRCFAVSTAAKSVLRSDDAGASWHATALRFTTVANPAIACGGAATCVAYDSGVAYLTTNEGKSWHHAASPASLSDISCPTGTSCWAVGRTGSGTGGQMTSIEDTTDGLHWATQAAPPASQSWSALSCGISSSLCVAVAVGPSQSEGYLLH